MSAPRKVKIISISDAAASHLQEIIENADAAVAGLRVGIKNGGCAGMEYTMDLVEEANPADDVIEEKGVRVFVDPSAVLFLIGSEMDFETTKFRSGFVFHNPNEVSACGCGESVSLKEADPSLLA